MAAGAAAVLRTVAGGLFAADSLNLLGADDISRLKLDFNSNKGKVRLVFMLSPT